MDHGEGDPTLLGAGWLVVDELEEFWSFVRRYFTLFSVFGLACGLIPQSDLFDMIAYSACDDFDDSMVSRSFTSK